MIGSISLTSILPLGGNTLDGSKNIWSEYIYTTIYAVTYLHFDVVSRPRKKIKETMKWGTEKSTNSKLKTNNYPKKYQKHDITLSSRDLEFYTYKSFRFLCIMQEFICDRIGYQFAKLASWFSRNLKEKWG